jgi:hypothetical protein
MYDGMVQATYSCSDACLPLFEISYLEQHHVSGRGRDHLD